MRKGFTLIELLVVIAIIGIIASMIAIPISGARKKCKDQGGCDVSSTVKDAVKTMQTEFDDCKKLENTPQRDLPAKCLKYYTK